tara:strand:- start:1164 stop:1409 length:246 start_codon:yes stop_codon:yes gene_type:complete
MNENDRENILNVLFDNHTSTPAQEKLLRLLLDDSETPDDLREDLKDYAFTCGFWAMAGDRSHRPIFVSADEVELMNEREDN